MADPTNYIEAINRYRSALEAAAKIANDPFKAPEQNVFEARDNLMPAIWEMWVEFAALTKSHDSKRKL